MSNPGGINLNISPYFDDYDEEKKFARILYRPGRAVQARELTQGQSIQQKQIQRFANFFFRQGSIVQGCEQSIDLNMDYVKLQDNFNGSSVDVSNFLNAEVFGKDTGIRAFVGLVTDSAAPDPKTLYINYLTSGSVRVKVIGLTTSSMVLGEPVQFFDADGGSLQITGTLVDFDIDPISADSYIWVNDLTGSGTIPTSGTPVIVHNTETYTYDITSPLDNRAKAKFDDGEQLFVGVYGSRNYALAETTNATQTIVNAGLSTEVTYTKGSKATIGEGIMYIADHFVLHSPQTIILDKYSNLPSYKVGLVPTKTFVDSAEDTTLLDNAQGTPNFQAPGSDRLKIDTSLVKVAYNAASSETEFVSMIEVENGIIKKRREIEIEGKIEEAIAKRTFDESGDYTLSDPRISIREHLNTGTNNGRYSAIEGGDSDLLLLEIDPFTAYVSGYRNEIISRANVNLTKGLDTQEVEQVNTQINLGSFVPVNEFVGFWDFENSDEIDLYDTAQTAITSRGFSESGIVTSGNLTAGTYTIIELGDADWDTITGNTGGSYAVGDTIVVVASDGTTGVAREGSKIGTARIKSVEYVSGFHGNPATVFNAYIYNVTMNAGKTFQEVRSIYQNNTSIADCVADIILDASGNATIREQAYDRLLFTLPYGSIKTLRDINGQLENGFRFRTEFSLNLSSGTGTVSSLSTNETFVGTGSLTGLQKNQNYAIVPQSTAYTLALEAGNTAVNGTTTVTGTASTYTSNFVAGDFVAINTNGDDTNGIYRIVSVDSATQITLDTAHSQTAGSQNIYKVFPAGVPIPMDVEGSEGARTMNVITPSAITIDLKEAVSLDVNFIATMDRANAREIRKNIVRDATAYITPTSHPNGEAGPYSLGVSDIFAIKAIYQSTDFTTIATVSDTNVTLLYTLDNGQRDNSYENGSIVPNVGVVPDGNLLVVFDHFTHDTTQGIGYLSIDSYPVDDAAGNVNTTISTTDVPTHISTRDGASYDLRNALDFRPIKSSAVYNTTVTAGNFVVGTYYEITTAGTSTVWNDVGGAPGTLGTKFIATDVGSGDGVVKILSNPSDSNTFVVPGGGSGLHIPVPNSDFQADLQYYKGRKAKLYMNYKGELGVVDGSPGYPNPTIPPSVSDTIDLAELDIPAYPSLPKNVVITPIKNRRFTMKDIGKLQERVNNIEYYTALNLLEKESRDKVIVDTDGIDRFKNGILADAFTGHSVADVSLPEYKAAIDRSKKYATSYFDNENQVALDYNSLTSAGITKTADNKIMLSYTEETFSDQPFASVPISLAQELSFSWVGDMKVVPATDNWLETSRNPNVDLVSDLTGESDNWKSLSDAWNTEVDPLTRHWVGTPNKASVLSTGSADYTISRATTTSTGKLQIESSNIDISSSELNAAVDRISDISVSHTMRSRDFVFEAAGLKDGTQLYAFFDGVDVTSNCKQIVLKNNHTISELNELFDNEGTLTANASYWEELSDGSLRVSKGKVFGVFTVPANSFSVGYRQFKLIDDSFNRDSVATTVAKYSIGSTGLAITKGQSSINTRPFSVAIDEANYVSSVSRVSTTSGNYTTTNYRRFDPLAQSFYIDESTYPRGVFLSSIDLFFSSKSSNTNLGVTLEIREMENGFPTSKVLGNEVVRAENGAISTSANSATGTTFTFGSPIYLLPGIEYCFAIKPDGNSTDFKLWSAILGDIDITDSSVDQRIDKQPAAGLLFTESNDFSWSVRQNQDLKYKMKIATFSTTTSGVVYFDNTEISSAIDYSRITTNLENLSISDTDIQYAINLYDENDEQSGYLPIKNLERLELTKKYQVKTGATPSLKIQSTLSTSSKYITPYIDLERVNVIPENLKINNLTQTEIAGTASVSVGTNNVTGSGTTFLTSITAGQYIKVGTELQRVSSVDSDTSLFTVNNFAESHSGVAVYTQVEEAPSAPYSSESRYISRRVALNDGFEASDINVYLDVSRPAATDIKVYYRILNESDSESFDDKFYREMSLEGTPSITQDTESYTEEKFTIPAADLSGGVQILYGTVTTTGSNATVTGVGTRFLEQLRIGDTVALGPNRVSGVVANVISNTEIALEETFTTALSGVEIFEVLNNVVGYTTPSGKSYSGFKYFSIKVVFLSSSSGYSPRIKNLRAIALA